jgi:RNA polymerase sigma-70 factor (ECF subfamily)
VAFVLDENGTFMGDALELGRLHPFIPAVPPHAAVTVPNDPPADLAATIRASAAGDQEAFARLYADYVRMVHAIVLGRVPRADVDDLVQDVFVLAYTRIGELRSPAAFGGWLATIARNRATDHLRHRREQIELSADVADVAGGDPIEAEAIAILDVIRKLPDAYRETLLMRLVEGMSGAEIAERTGLTPASVRVNLHRGMKLLRDRLEPVNTGRRESRE